MKIQTMNPVIKAEVIAELVSGNITKNKGLLFKHENKQINLNCACVMGVVAKVAHRHGFVRQELEKMFSSDLDEVNPKIGIGPVTKVVGKLPIQHMSPYVAHSIVAKHYPAISDYPKLVENIFIEDQLDPVPAVQLVSLNDGTDVDFPTLAKIIDEAL